MMERKLIYISHARLTDRISRDYFIDYCIERNAVVEYWDIVSLVREEHDERGTLDVDYLKYIKTYQQFEMLVRQTENQDAVYVMEISYSGRFSKPYRILSRYNCIMVSLNLGAMPVTGSAHWGQRRIISRFIKNPARFVKTVIDVLQGIAYKKLGIVNRFEIVFAAGSVLSSTNQYAKRVVPFNLFDYEQYNRVKSASQRVVKERYAVFLDINLPYQSDLAIERLMALNAIGYFKSLNRFFDLLENVYAIKVVIAAHPKANYINDEFNQREVYRMVTAELVKDAEFVITHTSTSLSYAVLNYKSILFIYTDEMLRIYKSTVIRQIESLASYLNANVYNIDKISNGYEVKLEPLTRERYELYKYNYITTPNSENLRSSEIFLHEIAQL